MKSTKHLLFLFALGACEGLTTAPEPAVSVLVRTTESCFALMTPSTPVAPALGVPDTCTYTANPSLLAGLDLVELVIDYGPDVSFAATTAAPPPAIVVTVDGAEADIPVTLSDEHRVGERAYFVATLRAPGVPSDDVQFTAGVNAGFRTTVPTVFTTVAPQVELQILDCTTGVPCELAGAVGDMHVRVLLPDDVPQTVAIHEAIDGIAEADPIPPVTTQLSETHTETVAVVPVPAAHDGAELALSAALDGAVPTTITATIHAPAVTVQLSCGDTCNLAAGDPVGIEVTAPALIRPAQAFVDTRLDGVPQLVAAPLALTPGTTGFATGTLAVHAPAQPGTWQIDVTVAGYAAPALVTTCH